ncbi:MAG: XrtA/PEP-CTERM system histidine kinase PrsK [Nitrospirota bacterium]
MNTYFAILPVSSAILCIGLGFFTFSRNPRHPANIGFAFGMLNLAVIEAGNAILIFSFSERFASHLGMRINLIGQALLPVSWLLFSTTFARVNYKEMLQKWFPVIIIMAAASGFFILWVIYYGPIMSSMPEHPLFIVGSGGRYFFIYLIIGLIFNIIHLENTLRSSTGSKRWQIKYVILGVGAIIAFFIYLSSQALLFSALNIEFIPLISSVILISVSVIAIFIVRHRQMDVDIFISRYVIYNSMTILIVGAYLLSIGIITYGIRYFDIPLNYFFTTFFIFVSTFFLIILLFSASLRRKAKLFINRHFYSHKYEFRDKWMEAIERISTKSSIDEAIKTFTEMVSETMEPKQIYLWFYDPVSQNYLSVSKGIVEESRRINKSHPLIKLIKGSKEPFLINDPGQKVVSAEEYKGIESLASKTAAVLCSPLLADDEIIGFILLGEDITGESYGHDDFQLLKAISTQAAVQIKNIRLINELMSIKEIEAFGRMSSFIMHDLKNLTNSLSLVSQNAKHNINNPEFQQDAIKTIDATVKRMQMLINRLSAVPKGLEIKKRSTDIKGLIGNAIKKIALSGANNVSIVEKIDNLPQISVDPHAIEMVFLNILKNAYEAIDRDGKIIVHAALVDNGNMCVTISDNGGGMSKEFIEKKLFKPFKTTKNGGLGIGLFQCKAVIEAHGGGIEVESEEGKGTVFRVRLPIEKEG